LVGRKVDIIVTQGTPAAISAKQATTKIPIVMAIAGDPVPRIVASYSRPGGNITDSSFFFHEINAKRLELMKTLMPALARGGVLTSPDNPAARYSAERQAYSVDVAHCDAMIVGGGDRATTMWGTSA
jgi:putative ABC transport system substrate-binding protein